MGGVDERMSRQEKFRSRFWTFHTLQSAWLKFERNFKAWNEVISLVVSPKYSRLSRNVIGRDLPCQDLSIINNAKGETRVSFRFDEFEFLITRSSGRIKSFFSSSCVWCTQQRRTLTEMWMFIPFNLLFQNKKRKKKKLFSPSKRNTHQKKRTRLMLFSSLSSQFVSHVL